MKALNFSLGDKLEEKELSHFMKAPNFSLGVKLAWKDLCYFSCWEISLKKNNLVIL